MIMEASVDPQPWGPDWMPITLKIPHNGVLFACRNSPLPPDLTYRPLPTLPFSRVKAADEAQKAAVLLWVIASGENTDLQRFASGTLPDVMHHLQLAQNLVSQLTGAAAPATN
jgi:hypothetical protein